MVVHKFSLDESFLNQIISHSRHIYDLMRCADPTASDTLENPLSLQQIKLFGLSRAVMHSAPIFMDLGSIRSNGQNLELDPLQIHEFPIGSRFDPDPIQIQGLST